MSAKIISERQRVTDYWYELSFYKKGSDRSGWLSFDCDENGVVLLDKLHPCAIDNYNSVKDDPSWYSEIRKCSNSYIENAKAECPYCHRTFDLWDEYMGACSCECGQWFNIFGQELNDPSTWADGPDW